MEERSKCCCFTGHRPEKLNISEMTAKKLLCEGIQYAIDQGVTTFITGMAKGVDTWAGEMVLEYKNIYPDIRLVCAMPYEGFAKGGTDKERIARLRILASADLVHNVSDSYHPFCFQSRNRWMVDRSDLVIALYTGDTGGTRNTIKYAEAENIRVINLLK